MNVIYKNKTEKVQAISTVFFGSVIKFADEKVHYIITNEVRNDSMDTTKMVKVVCLETGQYHWERVDAKAILVDGSFVVGYKE